MGFQGNHENSVPKWAGTSSTDPNCSGTWKFSTRLGSYNIAIALTGPGNGFLYEDLVKKARFGTFKFHWCNTHANGCTQIACMRCMALCSIDHAGMGKGVELIRGEEVFAVNKHLVDFLYPIGVQQEKGIEPGSKSAAVVCTVEGHNPGSVIRWG